MTTFALIHGAGSDGWYWHRVEPELRAAGHETIAVDLPCADDSAGLTDYADIEPDEIDSGHLPALARPRELAALLLRYEREAARP